MSERIIQVCLVEDELRLLVVGLRNPQVFLEGLAGGGVPRANILSLARYFARKLAEPDPPPLDFDLDELPF